MLGLLTKEYFKRTPWKVKLPIMVAIAFILISLPFILDILKPSIHEGSLYSFIYVLINILAIYVFGGIAEIVDQSIVDQHDLYVSNMVFMSFALIFWVLMSVIIAVFVDKSKNRKASSV